MSIRKPGQENGRPPYGFTRVGGKLVINRDEAEIVRQVFRLFITYKRKYTVASLLTELGFTTRTGKNFTAKHVSRILSNTVAIGMRRRNYTRSRGRDKAWQLRSQSEWQYEICPAIISQDDWDAAHEILELQKEAPPARASVHSFYDKIICSECNQLLKAIRRTVVDQKSNRKTRATFYRCRNHHGSITISENQVLTQFLPKLKQAPGVVSGWNNFDTRTKRSIIEEFLMHITLHTNGELEYHWQYLPK